MSTKPVSLVELAIIAQSIDDMVKRELANYISASDAWILKQLPVGEICEEDLQKVVQLLLEGQSPHLYACATKGIMQILRHTIPNRVPTKQDLYAIFKPWGLTQKLGLFKSYLRFVAFCGYHCDVHFKTCEEWELFYVEFGNEMQRVGVSNESFTSFFGNSYVDHAAETAHMRSNAQVALHAFRLSRTTSSPPILNCWLVADAAMRMRLTDREATMCCKNFDPGRLPDLEILRAEGLLDKRVFDSLFRTPALLHLRTLEELRVFLNEWRTANRPSMSQFDHCGGTAARFAATLATPTTRPVLAATMPDHEPTQIDSPPIAESLEQTAAETVAETVTKTEITTEAKPNRPRRRTVRATEAAAPTIATPPPPTLSFAGLVDLEGRDELRRAAEIIVDASFVRSRSSQTNVGGSNISYASVLRLARVKMRDGGFRNWEQMFDDGLSWLIKHGICQKGRGNQLSLPLTDGKTNIGNAAIARIRQYLALIQRPS